MEKSATMAIVLPKANVPGNKVKSVWIFKLERMLLACVNSVGEKYRLTEHPLMMQCWAPAHTIFWLTILILMFVSRILRLVESWPTVTTLWFAAVVSERLGMPSMNQDLHPLWLWLGSAPFQGGRTERCAAPPTGGGLVQQGSAISSNVASTDPLTPMWPIWVRCCSHLWPVLLHLLMPWFPTRWIRRVPVPWATSTPPVIGVHCCRWQWGSWEKGQGLVSQDPDQTQLPSGMASDLVHQQQDRHSMVAISGQQQVYKGTQSSVQMWVLLYQRSLSPRLYGGSSLLYLIAASAGPGPIPSQDTGFTDQWPQGTPDDVGYYWLQQP